MPSCPLDQTLKHLELLPLCPPAEPTCVVEDGGADGAVLKHGVRGADVLKETVFEQRVLEPDRLHLDPDEPARMGWDTDQQTHTGPFSVPSSDPGSWEPSGTRGQTRSRRTKESQLDEEERRVQTEV